MRNALILILLFSFSQLMAQDRHWVFFTDKGDLSTYQASDLLSADALRNRAKQGISLDSRDFPVNEAYVQTVRQEDILFHHRSRWFNAISVSASPETLDKIASFDFVREIRPVTKLQNPVSPLAIDCDTVEYLGTPLRQLGMLGLDDLHQEGFTGAGVKVAVFDNGYYRIDSLPAFAHLFDSGKILGQYDFVDQEINTFDKCIHCKHGTYVFSIMAAVWPGTMYGGSPDASYFLFRTEDDYSETTQEEDNWVAAAELADSLGAQIFNTSLGYKTFDNGINNYSNEELDGNTAIITIAGDIAASRGILVVNSAGNNGNRGINAPADGDSVLAVGAVDECEEIAWFSSRGPSADGRIKPDLSAMGFGNTYVYPDGTTKTGGGTSFSAPLITSLAACLMQKHPELTAWDVHQLLIQSSDRYDNPNNVYGHGIPHANRFEQLVADRSLSNQTYEDFQSGELIVYPNPATDHIRIAWIAPVSPVSYSVELLDASGRRIVVDTETFSDSEWQITLPLDLPRGIYVVRMIHADFPDVIYQRKVFIQ